MEELNNQQSIETTDNSSDVDVSAEVSKALDEPEAKIEPTKVSTKDNIDDVKQTETQCPEKFKNEDGSTNVDKLTKSYKELEPLLNEKAEWQKERAELLKSKEQLDAIMKQQQEQQVQYAQQQGFNSVQDMQQTYEIANFEANEYAKYLQYVDEEDREMVREMLVEYSQNPSEQLMRDIELEFAPEINKRIAIQSFQMKENFQNQAIESANTQKITNLENVIRASVEANEGIFDYEPFNQLYVNALQKFGDNFTVEDSIALINMVEGMKAEFRKEFEKEYGIKRENSQATDRLASISGVNSAPAEVPTKDTNKLSKGELSALVSKFI